MTGWIGSALLLVLIVVGLFLTLGGKKGGQLILKVCLIGLFLPVALCLILGLFRNISSKKPPIFFSGIGLIIFLGLLAILVGVAVVRFINRRRRLKTWRGHGQKPTSLKRRVGRD